MKVPLIKKLFHHQYLSDQARLELARFDIGKFQPQILTVSHERVGHYHVCFHLVLDTKTSCLILFIYSIPVCAVGAKSIISHDAVFPLIYCSCVEETLLMRYREALHCFV